MFTHALKMDAAFFLGLEKVRRLKRGSERGICKMSWIPAFFPNILSSSLLPCGTFPSKARTPSPLVQKSNPGSGYITCQNKHGAKVRKEGAGKFWEVATDDDVYFHCTWLAGEWVCLWNENRRCNSRLRAGAGASASWIKHAGMSLVWAIRFAVISVDGPQNMLLQASFKHRTTLREGN